MNTTLAAQQGCIVTVDDGALVIRVALPDCGDASTDDAAFLVFAATGDKLNSLLLWHRYRAVYALWQRKVDVVSTSLGDRDDVVGRGRLDCFTRVYDPMCQTAASFAAVAGVRQPTAENFVDRAIACMERIPAIGRLMRDGVLIPLWFHAALAQTEGVVDDDVLAVIDAEAAELLRTAGSLSKARVIEIVAAVVAEHDADAARAALEAAKPRKRVVVTPVNPELTDLTITASAEDATLARNAVDAVAGGVCAKDPRTKQARRSDAAIALLTGALFACQCDDPECTAREGVDAAAQCAKVVLHVVVRRESLTGDSDLPAYLDGHGPISAAHARDMAGRGDAVTRDLDLGELFDHTSQPSDGYRPTATCATAVRAVHGRCTHPGCDAPAWSCDLDHVVEYDHDNPAAGGATCPCNLNPKCRFHHGLKTHVAGWVDDQVVDANGVIWTEVTTPEGVTVRSRALNGWLLPELGLIPCRHDDAPSARRPVVEAEAERATTRTAAKHRYRMQIRARNRRQRAGCAGVPRGWGEPPF